MTTPTPQWLVQGALELVSLPDVFLRINGMMNDNSVSLQEIGEVVALDAGLTARLLKVVNSPIYGHAARIGTISRAISIVGMNDFYHLLLSTCASDMFKRIPYSLVNMTDFWVHSVYCAVIARQLAKQNAVLHAERFFVAGLLHQLGSLLIYQRLPDESREMLLQVDGRFWLMADRQKARWGFTYADVGAELARQWGLPESLRVMIGCHLAPETAGEHLFDTTLLHLAYILKNHIFQADQVATEIARDIIARAGEVVAMDEQQIMTVLSAVPEQAEQALQLLEGKTA
ncbi:MAG: HDOD domain-containing protein [Methylococcaceae bacterium]|nr:MAG: HDOD domain-containing protein [Methylococcaceae bacterium]